MSHKSPLYDANAIGGNSLGALPEWNLDDLYTAEDAPELTRDMAWLETACADFARDHDLLKWAQELERLDREWFLPISTALGNGSIERLTIHSPLADWTQTFQLTRRNYRFRFWRASKPLGSYA